MFGQLFGKYLVKENILDEETLNKILSAQLQIRVKLGVIAVADKLLTTEQADEINRIQQQEDKRFGDIAIEKGWLTDAQISELLEKQGNPYMQFLQVLVENSSIKISKIDGYIDDFQKELGLNDEQMAALKKDDVDGDVGAFTKDAQGYAAKIASLVLRNITRFVSNNYYIDNMKKIDHLDYRCMAAQKSEGAHDFCIGFAMKDINETFIKVAEGYTGEQFNMTGVEVSDAVGEFVNCISGLFATAMAKDGMELEILPQVAYENQVAKGEAPSHQGRGLPHCTAREVAGVEVGRVLRRDRAGPPGDQCVAVCVAPLRIGRTRSSCVQHDVVGLEPDVPDIDAKPLCT